MAAKHIRYPEIDMLKGLACVLMLIGHAVRVDMPAPRALDKIILYIMDFSGPIFFFVSGMNVMTFLERNRDKPGFAADRFYYMAAILLFVLGYTYNINRVSLAFFDIFQGVAMCTMAVYFLMRSKLPTWAHFAIMAAAFVFYTQFRVRLQLDMVIPDFSALKAQIPSGADFMVAIKPIRTLLSELGPMRRMLFVHFSMLPWVVFFYMGALCYRSLVSGSGSERPWWILFSVLFAAGPVVHLVDGGRVFPQMFLDSYLDLMIRGIPSYVLITVGGAGLSYLLARRFYKGAKAYTNRAVKWMFAHLETLGKESLLFLVVHWWVIATVRLPIMVVAKRGGLGEALPWAEEYSRAIIVLVATLFFVPFFAAIRNRWDQANRYGLKMGLWMGFAIFCALLFLPFSPFLSNYASYGSSFGFAFLYPYLRRRLRARYTQLPPAAA
ncbi:MAG: heparan-alpha-glucosaminide N-acetyltransferase domain-containing protein [Candidatus Lernaella stagnicola]|nr:heparan-alpha-glucosaminide N-acetyltransferase domain-containing protein [Candidatus Lernaella stagnicola]